MNEITTSNLRWLWWIIKIEREKEWEEKKRKNKRKRERERGKIQDKVILILLNFKVDFDYVFKCNFLNRRKQSIIMFKSWKVFDNYSFYIYKRLALHFIVHYLTNITPHYCWVILFVFTLMIIRDINFFIKEKKLAIVN